MNIREASTPLNDNEWQRIADENIGQVSGNLEEIAGKKCYTYCTCVYMLYPKFVVSHKQFKIYVGLICKNRVTRFRNLVHPIINFHIDRRPINYLSI